MTEQNATKWITYYAFQKLPEITKFLGVTTGCFMKSYTTVLVTMWPRNLTALFFVHVCWFQLQFLTWRAGDIIRWMENHSRFVAWGHRLLSMQGRFQSGMWFGIPTPSNHMSDRKEWVWVAVGGVTFRFWYLFFSGSLWGVGVTHFQVRHIIHYRHVAGRIFFVHWVQIASEWLYFWKWYSTCNVCHV